MGLFGLAALAKVLDEDSIDRAVGQLEQKLDRLSERVEYAVEVPEKLAQRVDESSIAAHAEDKTKTDRAE